MNEIISVFGTARSHEGDKNYEEARLLGKLLAEAGYVVCSGGFTGAMEAVSRGAHQANGKVIGVTCEHLAKQRDPNPYIHQLIEECDLFARIKRLTDADGLIALAGGIGTLAEIAIAWNLLQTSGMPFKPLILVGEGWESLIDDIKEHLMVSEQDFRWVKLVKTPEEALTILQNAICL